MNCSILYFYSKDELAPPVASPSSSSPSPPSSNNYSLTNLALSDNHSNSSQYSLIPPEQENVYESTISSGTELIKLNNDMNSARIEK